MNTVDSTSNDRVVNNVMRHEYKVLTEDEKSYIKIIKDMGLNFHEFLSTLPDSREVQFAKARIEEAVMWATKAITY